MNKKFRESLKIAETMAATGATAMHVIKLFRALDVPVERKLEFPHIWLYCKNHYVRSNNELDDLRKLSAHFAGCEVKYIRDRDVLQHLAQAAREAIQYCYDGNYQELFRALEETFSYTQMDQMFNRPDVNAGMFLVRVYRNIIALAPMSGLSLPAPDPKILPLTSP
jgi:hypothetical protein